MDSLQTLFIIGSGAIGKALAVFLQLEGRRVILLKGHIHQGRSETQTVCVEMADGSVSQTEVTIHTLDAFSELPGIVVLANKSFGNERLAQLLRAKTGNSPIVLLQNGLGVEAPFLRAGYPSVYRCVLFVTSQVRDQGRVRFRPVSVCPVGVVRGNASQLKEVVRWLDTENFHFSAISDLGPIVWKKAIVNCVFNSICALLETDNGIFHRNSEALALGRRVIAECTSLAQLQGIAVGAAEAEASLLEISRRSDGQQISTLQDIRMGRRTEIDTLNIEMARIAVGLQQPELVQQTQLLGELTRLKAELAMARHRPGEILPDKET
ncbi:ketopantoate reductase [Pedobacter yulinensis]|uniref:2-dehydropantoate 2-reductase n=1 Tax=Pedobacter yulinensis TaxID=2126353 RepID=A0A2T3HMG8_9SPHI|nr:2-dehydropantoate 2-reductase [Pedobacter yulinensis]PST83629.1 ketopantoate reductase [Pedobacter yulinensis]